MGSAWPLSADVQLIKHVDSVRRSRLSGCWVHWKTLLTHWFGYYLSPLHYLSSSTHKKTLGRWNYHIKISQMCTTEEMMTKCELMKPFLSIPSGGQVSHLLISYRHNRHSSSGSDSPTSPGLLCSVTSAWRKGFTPLTLPFILPFTKLCWSNRICEHVKVQICSPYCKRRHNREKTEWV